LNPKPHEAQIEDQKKRKSQEGHLEEGKVVRPTESASRPLIDFGD
jgi:hypothetical protein